MEFRQFDKHSFQATLKAWELQAEEAGMFPGEQAAKLSQVEKTLLSNSNDSQHKDLAYAVFRQGCDVALASCELVLSDRGSLSGRWLKMLKVVLCPEIDAGFQENNVDATSLAVSVYRCAVLGSFSERLNHEADTLKLYGRDHTMMQFLATLFTSIPQGDPDLHASKEGRWLVIRSK